MDTGGIFGQKNSNLRGPYNIVLLYYNDAMKCLCTPISSLIRALSDKIIYFMIKA